MVNSDVFGILLDKNNDKKKILSLYMNLMIYKTFQKDKNSFIDGNQNN